MPDNSLVVVCLSADACATVIGALWAVAASAPAEERRELLQIAAQLQVEQCKSMAIDPLIVRELLIGLPPRLRGEFADQLTRQARLRTPM